MRRHELAIEQLEAPGTEPRDEMRERDFRGVAHPADHRLAEKGAPQRHAIEAADQLPVVPAFDAMGMAHAEQSFVARTDHRVDPRRRPVVGGFGAQRRHRGKGGVGGDAETFGEQQLAQAARQVKAIERQDRAQPRFDPMDRRVVRPVGHREYPLRIGAEQQRGVDRFERLAQLAGFTNFSVMRSDSPIATYFSRSISLLVSVGGRLHTPFS